MSSPHVNGSELRGARFLKIYGNTYENRDKIKSIGGAVSFSSAEKCWVVNLIGLAQGQRAAIAQRTYDLGKLGLRFEVES